MELSDFQLKVVKQYENCTAEIMVLEEKLKNNNISSEEKKEIRLRLQCIKAKAEKARKDL
ncbi:MAG: hypothetical protein Q8N87_01520 [bacterium]|nr:hypothetical protein [bacterium]